MAMELAFETLLLALETTRGTAISSPTHLLNMAGKITPKQSHYNPKESRGTLAGKYRNKVVRRGSEWEGEGDADPNLLPVMLNMVLQPRTTPTTPGGGTNSRVWNFVRAITADSIKSGTLWWGDPGVQKFRSDYCMADELVISNNASNEGVASAKLKGKGGFPAKVSAPSVPSSIVGDVLPGQLMQVWIDVGSGGSFGSTAVTGRVISAEHTIPTGVTYKHLASGPTSALDFSTTGRDRVIPKTKVVLEVPDLTQYDNWADADLLKIRVRHNGAEIESGFYNYFQVDMVGHATMFDWGTNQNSNRTIEITIEGEYDATAGSDVVCEVQNARTSL